MACGNRLRNSSAFEAVWLMTPADIQASSAWRSILVIHVFEYLAPIKAAFQGDGA